MGPDITEPADTLVPHSTITQRNTVLIENIDMFLRTFLDDAGSPDQTDNVIQIVSSILWHFEYSAIFK